MKTGLIWFMAVIISAFVICGCSPKAKYDRKLKHELASGVRYDSLFMGIYFGMPEKEFYLHCWKLNQKGLIKQGESNTTVVYELKNELRYPALMDFYPRFTEGRIYELPIRFKYKGWAPWNKNLTSDKLQLNVLNWYKEVYGRGFMEVRHPQWGAAYVKINGNRRISIFKENELYVWAVFTDMLVKKDSFYSNPGTGNSNNNITKDLDKEKKK
jgi:hypothetical protein